MTATRDALWTIRNPVGRVRDLPVRRQSAAPRLPGPRGRPFVIECTPEEAVVAVHAQDRRFLEQCGRGPVALLSDAAHPMLASMGQGASSENRLALAARNVGVRRAPTCVLTRQIVRLMWFDMAWTAL